jgi:hypothetical protein
MPRLLRQRVRLAHPLAPSSSLMATRNRSTDSTVAPTLSAGLASQLHRCLFTCQHLLLACPERQHQHLATLAVAQGEVAAEARDGPNHRQHPLTHEPEVLLEIAVVSDTGKAREPPEHTMPFGLPGFSPSSSRRHRSDLPVIGWGAGRSHAAVHPEEPPLLDVEPGVGGERVCTHVRRLPASGRVRR